MYGLAVLALAAPLQLRAMGQAQDVFLEEPNILVVIADDVGTDMLKVYDDQTLHACTPTIDALAARGMVFHNAWGSPVCSPSRAQILTGRYPYRTGVGQNAGRWEHSTGLSTAELALPEVVPQYNTAWVGKWHLAHPSAEGEGPTHPNDTGFDYFAGSLFNLVHGPQGSDFNYFEWEKTVNGDTTVSRTYATTDTANEAIFAANTLQEPWLVVASFNAPHVPRHNPPADLVDPGCPLQTGRVEARRARKMVNALDTELARILTHIDRQAYVIFMGDNGSAQEVMLPPYDPTHGKGTMYETGVGIPLIVAGPGIEHGECDALVSASDIFSTVAELAGVSAYAEDSISLLPYLTGETEPLRETVYAERFSPNGYDTDFEERHQAIRSQRYKLIVSTEGPEEFYDLDVDPHEQNSLVGNLTDAQRRAYEALRALLPDS